MFHTKAMENQPNANHTILFVVIELFPLFYLKMRLSVDDGVMCLKQPLTNTLRSI